MTFYLYHDIVFVSYYLFKDHVTVNYSPAKLEAEPRSHYLLIFILIWLIVSYCKYNLIKAPLKGYPPKTEKKNTLGIMFSIKKNEIKVFLKIQDRIYSNSLRVIYLSLIIPQLDGSKVFQWLMDNHGVKLFHNQ